MAYFLRKSIKWNDVYVIESSTLYVARSSTTQTRVASLPTGTVTLLIGSANFGTSETHTQQTFLLSDQTTGKLMIYVLGNVIQ